MYSQLMIHGQKNIKLYRGRRNCSVTPTKLRNREGPSSLLNCVNVCNYYTVRTLFL